MTKHSAEEIFKNKIGFVIDWGSKERTNKRDTVAGHKYISILEISVYSKEIDRVREK